MLTIAKLLPLPKSFPSSTGLIKDHIEAASIIPAEKPKSIF
jgi:hypothetical protein